MTDMTSSDTDSSAPADGAERIRRIVVGFDGSDESTAALDEGLTIAARTGASVDVLTSWRWPLTWSTAPVGDSWSPLHDAEEVRQHAVALVERRGPLPVDVSTRSVEGAATAVLLDAAAGAGLLVVGSRGRGGFRGLLLGSVSAACITHAPCPVLVHRTGAGSGLAERGSDGARTIVVGVDGSPESAHALRFAVTLARSLGLRVRTVTTWQWPPMLNRDEAPFDHWSPEQDALSAAAPALEAAQDLVGDEVRLTSELVEGPAAAVLLDASRGAAMLVLGNRGLGGFRGLLVGSVSQECAQHASSPVIVHRS